MSCLQGRDDTSGHLEDGAHGVGHFKHGFLVLLGDAWQEVRSQELGPHRGTPTASHWEHTAPHTPHTEGEERALSVVKGWVYTMGGGNSVGPCPDEPGPQELVCEVEEAGPEPVSPCCRCSEVP